jgi:hypothetical protein
MRGFCVSVLLLLATVAGAEIDVLGRDSWGAQPARVDRVPPIENVTSGKRRVSAENQMPAIGKVRYLTVHHTARSPSTRDLADNLRRFQKQMFSYDIDYGNGTRKKVMLGDLPYHFFIDGAGRIGEGRETRFAPYSNTQYATPIQQHVTVVLDGNFERTPPSTAQIDALVAVLTHLARVYDVPVENIQGHKHVAQTLCPGKHLDALLPEVRARVRSGLSR